MERREGGKDEKEGGAGLGLGSGNELKDGGGCGGMLNPRLGREDEDEGRT